ncbi:MAG: hypothetical protein ACM3PW_15470, partial [Chlamydiota bacterium]
GFGLNHTLRTTDQGLEWLTDSYSLPNAPANAIIIDPDDSNTLYVATDVGVYTTNNYPNWTELGQLPSVAVTRLHIFESGGIKQLRAGTYGRGIWSYNIPYQIKVTTPHLYPFPGQTGTINGIITGYNGYSSPVDIECPSGLTFATCTGTTVTPMPSGTPFSLTVTAGSNPMLFDYSFAIQGTGADPNSTIETAPVTVSVVNYSFDGPTPNSLTADQGSSSAPATLNFNGGYGGFYEPINLSCSNLPTGATCNFFPSATIPPMTVYGQTVTLTVSAAGNTPVGSSTVNVVADAAGQPSPETASFALSIGNAPDYSLAVLTPKTSTVPGSSANIQLSLTPTAGFSGAVTLACNAGSFTCSLSPASPINLSAGPATVSATISVPPDLPDYPPGGGVTPITFNGTVPGTATHYAAASLTIMDFALTWRNSSASIYAGQAGQYELFVAPSGPPFTNPVSFSCSELSAGSTCTFSPATVTPGSSPAIVVLSVSTSKTTAELHPPAPVTQAQLMLALLLPGIVVSVSGGTRNKKLFAVLLVVVLAALILQPACGGGGSSYAPAPPPPSPPPPPPPSAPPPPVSYNFTVTATSGTVQHQIPLTLLVQPQ